MRLLLFLLLGYVVLRLIMGFMKKPKQPFNESQNAKSDNAKTSQKDGNALGEFVDYEEVE